MLCCLCSILCSVPETKVNIVKVIRSILRENVRRNMGTLERGCKDRLAPLRRTLPFSAKLGENAEVVLSKCVKTPDVAVQSQRSFEVVRSPHLCPGSSRASWLSKQPVADLSAQPGYPKPGLDSDEGSLSSGTFSLSGAPPSSASPELHVLPAQENWSGNAGSTSQARSPSAVKESDILSDEDDDGFSEGGVRRGSGDSSSPTSAIEAQFLQLQLSEAAVSRAPAPCVQPEGLGDTPETQPRLLRGHFSAVKRKASSLKRSQEALGRLVDSRAEVTSPSGVVDLNALLEREFSVQSLASVVNEDCFYEAAEGGNSRNVTSA